MKGVGNFFNSFITSAKDLIKTEKQKLTTPAKIATVETKTETKTYISKCSVHWVRHAESCSNIAGITSIDKIMHPPLTPLGIAQAINLGYYLQDNGYNAYYSSPSVRTIMTAIFSLRMRSNVDYITLIITPWISENLNFADKVSDIVRVVSNTGSWDRQNSLPPPNNLKKIVQKIKDWISTTYNNEYFDMHLYNLFNQIIDLFKQIYDTYPIQNTTLLTLQSSLENIMFLNNKIKLNASNNIIFPNNLPKNGDTLELTDEYEANEEQSAAVLVDNNDKITFKDLIELCRDLLNLLEIFNNSQSYNDVPPKQTEEKEYTPNEQYYGVSSVFQSRQQFDPTLLKSINKILNQIEIIDTNKFLNGPNIDFDYYEEEYKKIFDTNRVQKIKPSNTIYHDTFLQYINNKYPPSNQIIVFTHGGTIEKLLDIKHPNNTSVYESFQNKTPRLVYCPNGKLIYNTKQCDINGDKYFGKLIEGNVKHNTCTKDNPMGKLFNTIDYLFKETSDDKMNHAKRKYLKYKNKYISLKNKLSNII